MMTTELFTQEVFNGDRQVIASGNIVSRGSDPVRITLNKGTESEINTIINFRILEKADESAKVAVNSLGGSIANFSVDIVRGTLTNFVARKPFAESDDAAITMNMSIRCSKSGNILFMYTFFHESIESPKEQSASGEKKTYEKRSKEKKGK